MNADQLAALTKGSPVAIATYSTYGTRYSHGYVVSKLTPKADRGDAPNEHLGTPVLP